MSLPKSVERYFYNINQKVSWCDNKVGLIKGLLSYYYKKDSIELPEIIYKLFGLMDLHNQNNNDFTTIENFVNNILFTFGAYSKRWEIKNDIDGISQLQDILKNGTFGIGIQFNPILGIIGKGSKCLICYFMNFDLESDKFNILIINDNNSISSTQISTSELLQYDSITYFACEFTTKMPQISQLLKKSTFLFNIKFNNSYFNKNNLDKLLKLAQNESWAEIDVLIQNILNNAVLNTEVEE